MKKHEVNNRAVTPLTDEQIREEYQKRFKARVDRVLEAMKRERVDFTAQHFIASDGRPAARIMPVEMQQPQQASQ